MAASRPPLPKLVLALVSLLVFLGVWLNSGTLTPMAASLPGPVVDPDCGYLYNWDQRHHLGPQQFLNGEDPEQWKSAAEMRRILYHLAAYPFLKGFGYAWGGVVANSLFLIAAILLFGAFVRVRVGTRGAITAMWLIASYPGIAYYGGLPYSHAGIIPIFLLGYMLLYRIHEAKSLAEACGFALVMGVLLMAYDFFPFFGPAAGLLLLLRRKWLWIPVVPLLMLLPSIGFILYLKYRYGWNPFNEIGAQYPIIIGSYLHPGDLTVWFWYIKRSPLILAHVFLFSNFLFVPLVFLVLLGRRALQRLPLFLQPVDLALGFSMLFVFVFNNLAPAYEGWQMRGVWIPRLYQPLLAIMVVAIARAVQAERSPGLATALPLLALVANLSITFSGIARLPHGAWFYWQFYRHTPESHYEENLDRHGRRPVGFCRKAKT